MAFVFRYSFHSGLIYHVLLNVLTKNFKRKALAGFGAWINKKTHPHIGPLKGLAKSNGTYLAIY